MNIDFAFIDSGTGGLPYMEYLKSICPEAGCIYLADTKNFPYGEKSREEIITAAAAAVKAVLQRWRPRAIVLACNTMSVTALDALRKQFPEIPFIGTVPAIKLAAEQTRNHIIGLLATNRTVQDPYTDNLIRKYAPDCQVFRRGDSRLISFIEHDLPAASAADRMDAVWPAVDFFTARDADTIVLGCTHFIDVFDDIQTAAGPAVQVIDSRNGVIQQAIRIAFSRNMADWNEHAVPGSGCCGDGTGNPAPRDRTFFVTGFTTAGEAEYYESLCRRYGIPWGGCLE